jgi:1,4-alpha-glucan branching enzyme
MLVEFVYHTGVTRPLFRNVRLCGSWDAAGEPAETWTTTSMAERTGPDGCPTFHAVLGFPEGRLGHTYSWGVLLDAPGGRDTWGIPTEAGDPAAPVRHRTFTLAADLPPQRYWLSTSRRFGANKRSDGDGRTGAEFAVWAPNARGVSLVFGDPTSGYIADDGTGVVGEPTPLSDTGDGVWAAAVGDHAAVLGRPYMFQVVKDNGRVAYRTDLYSRCQIGRGRIDPAAAPFSGRWQDLDGTVGCSVVIDPDRVGPFEDSGTGWLSEEEFWRDELDPLRPLPSRFEDLVIYELHVGGLGAGRTDGAGNPVPGNLADAMGLLDHLVDLGVNAVELLPLAEFEGWASWGYGTSHYFAVEFSEGGRDQLKHFVRACHRRGIAVILDVVYNHYHHQAERAEWAYDSDEHERNIYYWYEGRAADYPDPTGGYVDNMSTGWAPRLWAEPVRQMLISSAVAQLVEFHIDGFRVDQTTSLHAYSALHADGRPLPHVNAFGVRFLRELTRTLRLVKPSVFLIAEDHSGWPAVTQPTRLGGLGFDVTWYADFYHHLNGDTGRGISSPNLLTTAALGDNRPLAMARFGQTLGQAANAALVYHESHDEAGNSPHSGRTLTVAVGRAPLVGQTRRYAEARARFAAGMSLLSAGTPMFFMGEEVGAVEDYRYDDFIQHRTDLVAARLDGGADLFAFYRGLVSLRRAVRALRSRVIDVVHADDAARVLAFRRTDGPDDALVIASLNDTPFLSGYAVPGVPDGLWREAFNSDSVHYGGWNDGNRGADLPATGGTLTAVLPRAGFIVLRRL